MISKSLFCLSFLTFLLISRPLIAQKCLVADYRLNGDALDIGPFAKHGTLNGTKPAVDRFGNGNRALHFNGTSDFVKLGTQADYPERTISLWFRIDTFSANFGLVFSVDHLKIKYGGTGISVDSSGGTARISSGVGNNVLRFLNPVKNTWYHYALTINLNMVIHYLNGKILDSMANNSFTHSNDGDSLARLGSSRKADHFFRGSIDDVKIFNCALSPSEIAGFYKEASVKEKSRETWSLHPNPAGNFIYFDPYPKDRPALVSIYNTVGALVMEMPLPAYAAPVNIGGLASGVYLVSLKTNETTTTYKLVKE